MLRRIHHLRRQDAGTAVQRREGFVQLGHAPTDGGLLLHNINLIARFGDVQRCLDAGDTAANNQRPLHHVALPCVQRTIEAHLGNGRLSQLDGLGRSFFFILQYPGALLADIGNFYHV